MEKKWKNKKFFYALKNSIFGIKYAFKSEKNIKIQTCIAVIVIGLMFLFRLSVVKNAILLMCIGMVLCMEMINTVIENVLDLYSESYNEKIKIAKDIASGAVSIASMTSAIIGFIIFIPEILKLLNI